MTHLLFTFILTLLAKHNLCASQGAHTAFYFLTIGGIKRIRLLMFSLQYEHLVTF